MLRFHTGYRRRQWQSSELTSLSAPPLQLCFSGWHSSRVCNTTTFASWLVCFTWWQPEHAQSIWLDKELGSRHATFLPCMLLPYTQKTLSIWVVNILKWRFLSKKSFENCTWLSCADVHEKFTCYNIKHPCLPRFNMVALPLQYAHVTIQSLIVKLLLLAKWLSKTLKKKKATFSTKQNSEKQLWLVKHK